MDGSQRNEHYSALSTQDWLSAAPREKPAVIAGETRWTWGDLEREATRLAGGLRERGVVPGDRVAALLGNNVGFVALVHACIRLEAVLVPLNTRLIPAEIAWQLNDSGARLLIAECGVRSVDYPGCETVDIGELMEGSRATEQPAGTPTQSALRTPHSAIDLGRVQAVIYTSGTTGQPKGAMLTYGNQWWSAVGSALNLGTMASDRWLACLPMFHVGGLAILMRSVIYGVPVIVHERFDAAAVNRAIDEDGVTVLSVVSTMLTRMLDERGGVPYPPTLRAVLLGGGPAPRPLLEAAAAAGVPVVQTYGLTETASQVATLSPADALRKLGSAGKPLLPTRLRIAGPNGDMPPGEVGEILVQGPIVTPGYLGRPEATARALRGGWLHTGDLGYLDAEGYLYVVDRHNDLIISGGENVYPAEVEAALLAHPGVAEAGVVGVPDARWGQVPVAFVLSRPGAAPTEDELIAFCKTRLAGYKVPAGITFVSRLPRNASGKLMRWALRPGSRPDPGEETRP
ncbi:MAG: o-succinylbenzoate--CoA ligase [Chloroflexia bacterium]